MSSVFQSTDNTAMYNPSHILLHPKLPGDPALMKTTHKTKTAICELRHDRKLLPGAAAKQRVTAAVSGEVWRRGGRGAFWPDVCQVV